MQGNAGRAGWTQRRRWRRQSRPTEDIIMGAPAGYDNSAVADAVARCIPKPDPLAMELCACACAGPPAWVDSMLEELATVLVVTP